MTESVFDYSTLTKYEEALAQVFQEALQENLFEHRGALRPRKIPRIARDEAKAFLAYLQTEEKDLAISRAKKLEQTGLTNLSLRGMARHIRQFFLAQLPPEQYAKILNRVDSYYEILTTHFVENLEAAILQDQEHLRAALQATISEQAHLLTTSAEVAGLLSRTLELQTLLNDSVELIQERLNLYYVGIFLTEETGQWAILRAGSGDAGKQMLRRGHKLKVDENSMIGWCIVHQKGRVALDVGEDAVRFANPFLPDTHSEMALPLITRGKIIGAMTVQSERVNAFSDKDITSLNVIASQLASTIENARFVQRMQKHLDELEALRQKEIAEGWEELEGGGYLYVLNEDDFDPIPPDAPIRPEIREAAETKNIVALSEGAAPPASAALAIPITYRDEIVGVVDVYDTHDEHEWEEDEKALALAIASQSSLALENARLFEEAQKRLEETRRRNEEMALLNEIVTTMSGMLDIEKSFEFVSQKIAEAVSALRAGIALLDEEKEHILIRPEVDTEHPIYSETASKIKVAVKGNPLLEPVVSRGEIFSLTDIPNNPLLKTLPIVEILEKRGVKSLTAFPLTSGTEIIGIVTIEFADAEREIDENEKRLIQSILLQASTAIQNARLFQQMQKSEARFRDVALSSADWVWELDSNGGIYVYCSDRVEDVLGYKPEEVLGKSIIDFTPPEIRPQVAELVEKIAEEKQPLNDLEFIYQTKDGRQVILLANGTPILDDEGNLLGYRGVYKDITERKRNERLQQATSRIANAALTTQTLRELSAEIQKAVAELMPAESFYIALYDEVSNLLTFPYFQDPYENTPPSGPLSPGRGLTGYILRTGKPILVTPEKYEELNKTGEVVLEGTQSIDYLGVPLQSGKKVIGVMSVQTYDENIRLTQENLETLTFIANQAAVALEQKQSEIELRALFAALDDVVLVVDKETRYIRIAPTNPGRLYRPPDELLGKRMVDVLPPETHKAFKRAIEQALESGETVKIEYPLEIGGQPAWFDASISKLNEEQVYWVARDITDRKKAEERLKKQNEYMAAAAEIGRLVTSSLDMKEIFSKTVNLIRERFGYYHAAIFEVEETGFRAIVREATGKAGEEMKKKQHSLAVGSKSVVGTATSTGKPFIVNNVQESPLHRVNPLLPETRAEAAIPLRIGVRTIGALDIQSTETNAFSDEDIAVLQILADQIAVAIDNARSYALSQQAVKEMREVDKLKSQFLANMSHELRTPLNSIIGFSRVILKGIDGPITELQQQDLTAIYNSGQHLLNLINDILDLSKIEAGKMELAFDEVDLGEMIKSVMSTVTGLVKGKDIKLERLVPDDLPTVHADPMRVRQVLLNLFSNAAKFTEEGSITVEAAVQPGKSGRPEVLVKITDTGPGISPEDQKKLFQPFSQVDASPTRKTGGSGLGLSICRQLIQMHGGEIGVESEVGKGSTFYFTLPVYQEGTPLPGTPEEDSKRIILSVDDDIQVIRLYERYLNAKEYQVIPLTDPTHVVKRARELKPYAITLDIMMPGYDGWQVLADLKSNPDTRDIPVIICSIIEDEEKGYSLGAADYLVKPIIEEDLLNALQRLNPDGSIRNILIIDDDPDDLRLLEKILSESGKFNTTLAEGGTEGWKAIQTSPPDAVILDLFMPEMDGFTILEKLRSSPALREIPTLLITGGDLTETERKKLSTFGQQLLKKGSLSERELIDNLEKVLQRLSPRSNRENE